MSGTTLEPVRTGKRDQMAEKREQFIVLSRTENVQTVGARIDAICKRCGVSADIREDVVIAIDEAITNIMMHSYRGREDGTIEISCACVDGEIQLSLRDNGESFDMPPLDTLIERKRHNELVKGGYGLILMHKFMDDVIFSRDSARGNNVILMKKKLS